MFLKIIIPIGMICQWRNSKRQWSSNGKNLNVRSNAWKKKRVRQSSTNMPQACKSYQQMNRHVKMLKVPDQGTCKRSEISWNNVPKSVVSIRPKKRNLQSLCHNGHRPGESTWTTKQGELQCCLTQSSKRALPDKK